MNKESQSDNPNTETTTTTTTTTTKPTMMRILFSPRAAGALVLLSVVLFLSQITVEAEASIYPDDLWTYSTKLTTSNYVESIQSEIDNGKTVFVRFIASEVS